MYSFRNGVIFTLLVTLIMGGTLTYAADAADVSAHHWAYGPVRYAVEGEILTVNENGEFLPDGYIDKYDSSIAIARALGHKANQDLVGDGNFQYQKRVVAAYAESREKWSHRADGEIAFLLRAGVYEADDLSTFFVTSVDGEPKLRALSLEEACMYVARATKRTVQAEMGKYKTTFSDDYNIDPAMKPYVYYYHSLGYIKADGENKIKPKSAVTRALLATMIYQAFNNSPYNYKAADVTSGQTATGNNVYGEPWKDIITSKAYQTVGSLKDGAAAAEVVKSAAGRLSQKQKRDPVYSDQVVRLAEEALMKVCAVDVSTDIVTKETISTEMVTKTITKTIPGTTAVIDSAAINAVDSRVSETAKTVKYAITSSGIKMFRQMRTGIVVRTNFDKELILRLGGFELEADRLRIETPEVSFTIKREELNKLKKPADIKFTKAANGAVELVSGGEQIFITIGLTPKEGAGDINDLVVFNGDRASLGGRYNPYTNKLEVTRKGVGTYIIGENKKIFADMYGKPAEMREAAEILAAKGIMPGTALEKFSPDLPIRRGDFTMMLVKIMGIYEPQRYGTFVDVYLSDGYHNSVVSAKKYGLVDGFTDNKFYGDTVITKEQMLGMSTRALIKHMGYIPGDLREYLSDYGDFDETSDWVRSYISPAKRFGMIIEREDNCLAPDENISRGDAAVILKRLYDKMY